MIYDGAPYGWASSWPVPAVPLSLEGRRERLLAQMAAARRRDAGLADSPGCWVNRLHP